MKQLGADAALALVTLIWGATFVMVKESIQFVPPFPFLTLRFLIAALILLLFVRVRLTRSTILTGILLGSALFFGFALQTLGLNLTSASNAGFITGLNVVMVPILSLGLLKTKPSPFVWPGVGLATLGMGLLCIRGWNSPNLGDLLILGCALGFALHIVLISKYSQGQNIIALCFVQMVTGFLLSLLTCVALGDAPNLLVTNRDAWFALLFLGAVATAGGFMIQTTVQQFTTATRTALIFSMEPAFAAFFASLILHETFQGIQALGALLILVGIVICEIPVGYRLKTAL